MDLRVLFNAGYSDVQVIEVVLGLAIKLISNYMNSIAGTPIDPESENLQWEKPVIREHRIPRIRKKSRRGSSLAK